MPYITYFSSFEELNKLVEVVDVNEISNKMKKFNEERKIKIHNKWNYLLNKIK
jgi:NADPH-dependent 7-cyano-7-deazaguanine reductase QueF